MRLVGKLEPQLSLALGKGGQEQEASQSINIVTDLRQANHLVPTMSRPCSGDTTKKETRHPPAHGAHQNFKPPKGFLLSSPSSRFLLQAIKPAEEPMLNLVRRARSAVDPVLNMSFLAHQQPFHRRFIPNQPRILRYHNQVVPISFHGRREVERVLIPSFQFVCRIDSHE